MRGRKVQSQHNSCVVREAQLARLVKILAIDQARHQTCGEECVVVTVARAFAADPTVHLFIWMQKRVGVYKTMVLQCLQGLILPGPECGEPRNVLSAHDVEVAEEHKAFVSPAACKRRHLREEPLLPRNFRRRRVTRWNVGTNNCDRRASAYF